MSAKGRAIARMSVGSKTLAMSRGMWRDGISPRKEDTEDSILEIPSSLNFKVVVPTARDLKVTPDRQPRK